MPPASSPRTTPTTFTTTRHSPALWRVTFDNPPINLVSPTMIVELHTLIDEIEQDQAVAVVLFDSANPDFFIAHLDAPAVLSDDAPFAQLPSAPTAFHHWVNVLVRLGRSKAVTIVALRGRARGAGAEFAIAADIRFASREKAVLGQFEVGFAVLPGGGCGARLPGIVGRGRALEILLGGDDFNGDLAERYGYVNRAVPDTEFVKFVDTFAERVSRFDLGALADIKQYVNAACLPADEAIVAEMTTHVAGVVRPATQATLDVAFAQGFQDHSAIELNLGSWIGQPENITVGFVANAPLEDQPL